MKKLLLVLLLHHGPAIFDAWTTRRVIAHGGVERNPLARPFAHSPAIYLSTNVEGLIADVLYLSGHKKASRVLGVTQAVEHEVLGVHNLKVLNEMRMVRKNF